MRAAGLAHRRYGHEHVARAPREVQPGEKNREHRAAGKSRGRSHHRAHEHGGRKQHRGHASAPQHGTIRFGIEKGILKTKAHVAPRTQQLECSRVHELVNGKGDKAAHGKGNPPPHPNRLTPGKHAKKHRRNKRDRGDDEREARDPLLQVLVAKDVYVGYLLHVAMVPHAEKCQNG